MHVQVFHTRGLTLSMEYQSMKTVARRGQSWLPEYVSIPGSRHSEVIISAIYPSIHNAVFPEK